MHGRARRPRRGRAASPLRVIEGRVAALGGLGDGVIETMDGPVHAPLTAPGDVGRFEVRGARARLVELHTPSAHRRAPPCAVFGDCGGCALQHLDADFYRAWKRERVVDAVRRAGFDPAVVEPLVSAPEASRRRAVFAARMGDGAVAFGFNARRSQRIVDIAPCLILTPALRAALPTLRRFAERVPAAAFDLAATACDNGLDIDVQVAPRDVDEVERALVAGGAPPAPIVRIALNGAVLLTVDEPVVAFDGIAVGPQPGGFLQASHEAEAALIALAKEACAGARRIADLFCGCGAFALPLSRQAHIYAADAEMGAIAALTRAAAAAQSAGLPLRPVKAERRDLFERPLTPEELEPFDAVLFDPPRAGAAAQAGALAASSVPIVAAISCNPATFARDAATLAAGGRQLTRVVPIDQFIYSAHVELFALFVRR